MGFVSLAGTGCELIGAHDVVAAKEKLSQGRLVESQSVFTEVNKFAEGQPTGYYFLRGVGVSGIEEMQVISYFQGCINIFILFFLF